MNYPDWWAEGVIVFGQDGTRGRIGRSGAGGWLVHLDGEDGDSAYIINPDPGYWSPDIRATVTPTQLRRIAYEADRALLLAFGCGGLKEWTSVPESERVGGNPRPAPMNRPELDGLRALVVGAVREALSPYLED